jgi:hypothetical protein
MSVTIDDITYTYSGSTAEVQTFVPGSITTANIPSTIFVSPDTYNVTSIGITAFQGCTTLTSVTIPNSVTSIGDQAFYSCTSLNSATIGSSVTTIGNNAFQFCSALTSITIPDSVTSIGVQAFQFCTSLNPATIGSSVTTIGTQMFQFCSALTSVTIPNSVTSIGNSAFEYCTLLASATIGSSVTTIGDYAFQGCSALTSVTIPNSVTSIGITAFAGCTALTFLTIPNSVTSIGDIAFQGCSALTSLSIGSSVTSIGNNAFFQCTSLNLVYFLQPLTLPSIGSNAFGEISASSEGKYYATVTDTTPIDPPVFTSISTIVPPTLTAITSFTSPSSSAVFQISYANLAANGNEVVVNTPYVFLVNAVLTGSLSIGATEGSATSWNASTNNTIASGTNAYWTPAGTGLVNAFSVVVQDSFGVVSSPNVNVQVNLSSPAPPTEYPCFLEGTKILCFENNQEVYRPVESLRKGDLVKTIYNGYMPIHMIGTTSIYNPGNDYRVTNRLYKCSREKYPTLFEDLYITGCHSILVPRMTQDQWDNTKAVNGNVYVTDKHYRLIACADEKADPFNKEGFMNIYHIALEHNDYYMNYGIYANGLLVESCSKRYLTELSNMRILGQEDSRVSENVVNGLIRQLVDTY